MISPALFAFVVFCACIAFPLLLLLPCDVSCFLAFPPLLMLVLLFLAFLLLFFTFLLLVLL